MTSPEQTPDVRERLQQVPWRKVANVVGVILLVAIVVPFVIHAVPQVVGGDASYVVLSGSMEPAISPGDVVVISSTSATNIDEGDVITFSEGAEEQPTTHRVVDVVQQDGQRAFRTKGDANEDADQALVTPAQIDGKVMTIGGALFVIPLLGHIILFINSPTGFVGLFLVPIVLLVASEIWNVVSATRSDTDQGDDGDDSPVTADESRATPDANEAASTEGPSEEESSDGKESSDGITFTPADLQLGLVGFGAFLVYSVWVAYATEEVWAFTVLGSVAAAFLLLVLMYVFGGEGDADSDTAGTTDVGDDSDDDPGGSDREGVVPEIDVQEELAILDAELAVEGLVDDADGIQNSSPTDAGTQDGPRPAITRVESPDENDDARPAAQNTAAQTPSDGES